MNAAALALQNTLGLIYDPIGGYVEAPCMMRNGLFGLHAFGAAAISLSGVKSIVPFDEVVSALREVGHKMPRILQRNIRRRPRHYPDWPAISPQSVAVLILVIMQSC